MIDYLHFLHRLYHYRFRTERQQLTFLLSQNLVGTTVLDIGANRGIYSYFLSKKVGPQGTVHAVEPQPEMVEEIKRMQQWFGLRNIVLHEAALSSCSGMAKLRREHPGDGGASMEPDSCRPDLIMVRTISLDELCEQQGNKIIAYIKCDAEGHELRVFEGAVKTIETCKPLIQVEVRIDTQEAIALFQLFERLGYVGVMMLDGKFIPYENFRSVPSRKFGFKGHRDFIFTHHEKPVKLGNGTTLGTEK